MKERAGRDEARGKRRGIGERRREGPDLSFITYHLLSKLSIYLCYLFY